MTGRRSEASAAKRNTRARAILIFSTSHPLILSAAGATPSLDRDRAVAVRAAVERVTPSIVTIETIGGAQPLSDAGARPPPASQPARRRRGGSVAEFRVADGPTTGLVWSQDGLIITSSFNFVRDPTVITVVLADGRRFVARLLARDTIRRLALLKLDATDLPVPDWAAPSEIRVGQYAVACGRGFGGPTPSISVGMVSALGRRSKNAVQTDAKLSPANYGGPLIDIDGRVIGICVPMAGGGGELAGVEWYDSGIGFAIPRDRVEPVIERLAAGKDVDAGRIGVQLDMAQSEEGDDEPPRIRIAAIADPSPARNSGLQPGDIILAVNGTSVGQIGELQRRISDIEAGTQVTLTIERDDEKREVRVTLARPADLGPLLPPGAPPGGRPATQPSSQPAS